jgi:signal transduction histidine kinase/CheY-like chemotaxis protein
MSARAAPVNLPWFLDGGGVCQQTVGAIDWSRSPLGPIEGWPPTLQTTLATLFRARQPMLLMWGKDLIQFYNDAFLPSFGHGKHPTAMGQPGRECWGEVWPIVGGQIEDVIARAIPTGHEDALVPIFRNGRIEEVYWTYTYSPTFAADGSVAGVLVICTETTRRVVGERRANLLHALAAATSVASDEASLVAKTFAIIGAAPSDIPLAALYRAHAPLGALGPVASIGMSPDLEVALGQQLATSKPGAGTILTLDLESGSGAHSKRDVYVTSILDNVDEPVSTLVLGVNPNLSFDDAYRRFAEQLAGYLQVATTRIDEAARRLELETERRNLMAQAPVATALMVGPEHVFEIANPLYRQMVGRPHLVGQTFLEAFPELKDTPLIDVHRRVYERGEPFVTNEYLVELDKGNGVVEDCFFKFNLEPVRDARGKVYGMMAVAVEITEQVVARHVLEKANAERETLLRHAEAASRAKDEFLAMLGHELRNPLSPIMTALHLIRRKGEGTLAHEHAIIERHVKHLIRLVDDLLDVAKIARGKVELRRELVDLSDVIAHAVETAEDLLDERHHRLAIEHERGRFFSSGDPIRLSQIVANLLTNAAKYTDPGGTLTVRLWQEDGQNKIAVRDDGIGISAELLPRVFNLFEQGERSMDRTAGGLGIGLALVKNLVTLHEGSVAATSEGPGRGSEFIVSLPAVDHERASRDTSAAPARSVAAETHARVLVIDDNVDALELLKETLELSGHRVEAASDPLAALDLAASFAPDVAVIDIGLPVIDGYELAAKLRASPMGKGCRMVALTGYGQEHDKQRSREAGFDEHLVKPVDIDRLTALIATLAPRAR